MNSFEPESTAQTRDERLSGLYGYYHGVRETVEISWGSERQLTWEDSGWPPVTFLHNPGRRFRVEEMCVTCFSELPRDPFLPVKKIQLREVREAPAATAPVLHKI